MSAFGSRCHDAAYSETVRPLHRQRQPGAGAQDRAATSARELGRAEVFEFANENIFVKILDNVRANATCS